jgi:Uma2 family endonuclease
MRLHLIHPKRYPDSIVFHDASWDFYRTLLREWDDQPSRINYDRGTLELMTLSIEHEGFKSVLGIMLGLIALTFGMRVKNGGSTTLKRLSKRKGLDADLCFWVANEPAIRTKKRINLKTDPPPDLVIEIDVMHSVVNREKIYAALGVPEMWVLRKNATISAFALQNGKWSAIERSLSFPFLRVADLHPFVARIGTDDDTTILASFNQWLQAHRATTTNP